jgi:hypothetical protein
VRAIRWSLGACTISHSSAGPLLRKANRTLPAQGTAHRRAFIARTGLEEELTLALRNAGYADAILALTNNILVDRTALYAIEEWVGLFDVGLVARGKTNDDKIARVLDRLFVADRATLQTRIVLAVNEEFYLK